MKSILIIIISLFCFETNAQTTKNANNTLPKVVIGLGKVINGVPVIIASDNGKPIDTATFRSFTHLIAYYKTPQEDIPIDSICYDIIFYNCGDAISESLCGHNFKKNMTILHLMNSCIPEHRNIVIMFKIKKVFLSNGKILINPKVNNQLNNDEKYGNGVKFIIK